MTVEQPGSSGRRTGLVAPPGFLDAASGEPLHPAARAVLEELLGAADPVAWADPARRYGPGRRARIALDRAREMTAEAVGCRSDEVAFTSSGTEAIHRGVLGLLRGRERVGDLLVSSAVEHSAVLHAAEHHRASGGRSETVEVDAVGRVDLQAWAAAVAAEGVAAACLQSANHEVGTRQPLEAAAGACEAAGVPLLVDAAQSLGRSAPVPTGWSVLTGSAHKWGGPPGLGILAVRTGVRWRAPGPGDEREGGRAAGFPAVALALAAAAALEAGISAGPGEDARLDTLVARVREEVAVRVPDVVVLGDPVDRLPHVLTFSCLYVDGEALLDELDRSGFAVSSGSSCTSSVLEPSHVLVAMGALSHGNVRVSLPRGVDEADVDRFLTVLPEVVAKVRAQLGASSL